MFQFKSPWDVFIERIKMITDDSGEPLYTGIEAIELDSALWVDVARPRTARRIPCDLVLLGLGGKAGYLETCSRWLSTAVANILYCDHRRTFP